MEKGQLDGTLNLSSAPTELMCDWVAICANLYQQLVDEV